MDYSYRDACVMGRRETRRRSTETDRETGSLSETVARRCDGMQMRDYRVSKIVCRCGNGRKAPS